MWTLSPSKSLTTDVIKRAANGMKGVQLDKGMTHVLNNMKGDTERFHHTTQNSSQFKMSVLFIPKILT